MTKPRRYPNLTNVTEPKDPPDEYCPECMSLKRKPNKECKNHESYWIDKDVQIAIDRLKDAKKHPERLKPFVAPPPFNMNDEIDGIAEDMVREIANKIIVVQDAHEGRSHQRHWYLVAQKMVKKLVKEYERVCKDSYNL